jgi:hypothetical protein
MIRHSDGRPELRSSAREPVGIDMHIATRLARAHDRAAGRGPLLLAGSLALFAASAAAGPEVETTVHSVTGLSIG